MSEGTATARPAASALIVGGLALAVFTFLPWYDANGGDLTAWEALRRSDAVVFAAGLVAALCGAWLGFGDVGPERRAVALIGLAAAALGVLVVLIRLFSPPGEADASYGVFLALVASLVAAGGGLMAVGGGSPRG